MLRSRDFVRLATLAGALVWSGVGLADPPSPVEPPSDPKPNTPSAELDANTYDLVKQYQQGLRNRVEIQSPYFNFFYNAADTTRLGATLEPADESIRAQLRILDRGGLVVTAVKKGSAADRMGMRTHDVVLSLGDVTLANVDDFTKALKDAAGKTLSLKVMRGGKSLSIEVKPEVRESLQPHRQGKSRFQLGIQTKPLEPALRAQLGIADQQGVLVRGVESGSAAEKAGLKPHDVLLKVGDQPLNGVEDLVSKIQSSDGKALSLKVLRNGENVTVEVTPELRHDAAALSGENDEGPSVLAIRPSGALRLPRGLHEGPNAPNFRPVPFLVDPQLGDLRSEVRELRKAIEQLQKSFAEQSKSTRSEK